MERITPFQKDMSEDAFDDFEQFLFAEGVTSGLATSGLAPSSLALSSLVPSGLVPSGLAPSSLAPSGLARNVALPLLKPRSAVTVAQLVYITSVVTEPPARLFFENPGLYRSMVENASGIVLLEALCMVGLPSVEWHRSGPPPHLGVGGVVLGGVGWGGVGW